MAKADTATIHAAYLAFAAADAAWSIELQKAFGRHAGDVRYMKAGHGKPGSRLESTHDEFCRTRDAWHKATGLQ